MASQLLVAIDGSKHSERIVEFTGSLAKTMHAKVILLYVVPKTEVPEEYRQFARTERAAESDYFDEFGKAVLEKYSQVLRDKGVEHEVLTDVGNPADRVTQIAEGRHVETIIVGLQGLHGLGRLRSLGSVSRRIIENSSVPVLVVP